MASRVRSAPRRQEPIVPGALSRQGEKAGRGAAQTSPRPRSSILKAPRRSGPLCSESNAQIGRTRPHLRDAAPKRLETDIQGSILRYLAACPGVFARRMNSRVVTMPGKGGKPRLVRFGFEGCADIIGWVREQTNPGWIPKEYRARFLAVECKRPDEDLRPAQAAFLEQVRLAGGLAVVATSVSDVQRALGR